MKPVNIEPEAILAVGSFILFSITLLVVIFFKIPAENEKYVMLLLGAEIGLVKDTYARYFSSTKGAQQQREAYNELATSVAASGTGGKP